MLPNFEMHYFRGTPEQKAWVKTQCPKHLLPQSVIIDMNKDSFRKLEQRVAAMGLPSGSFMHVRVGD